MQKKYSELTPPQLEKNIKKQELRVEESKKSKDENKKILIKRAQKHLDEAKKEQKLQ